MTTPRLSPHRSASVLVTAFIVCQSLACGRLGYDNSSVEGDVDAGADTPDSGVVVDPPDANEPPLCVPGAPGPDADGDGVTDECDVCAGYDDAVDPDGDGNPTGCDPCPTNAPDDADGDGLCDTDQPLAHWSFDSDASDSFGNHHGAFYDDAKIVMDGERGGVLQVDGTGDYVEVPYTDLLNPPNGKFSVSVWVKSAIASPTGLHSVITSRMASPTKGYMIFQAQANQWEFWTGDGNAQFNTVFTPVTSVGAWTHIVAVSTSGRIRLFINGELKESKQASSFENYQNELRIGAGDTGFDPDHFFQGEIDDVRIYDFALSSQQVADTYNAQR